MADCIQQGIGTRPLWEDLVQSPQFQTREEWSKIRGVYSLHFVCYSLWAQRKVWTYHAAGSYSAQTLMNSSRWWGPRMEESLVRYSKLSIMTATNRFSIWNTEEDSSSLESPASSQQASSTNHFKLWCAIWSHSMLPGLHTLWSLSQSRIKRLDYNLSAGDDMVTVWQTTHIFWGCPILKSLCEGVHNTIREVLHYDVKFTCLSFYQDRQVF